MDEGRLRFLLAIAREIPLDAPVTSATLPSSDMDFLRFCADGGPDVPTTDPEFEAIVTGPRHGVDRGSKSLPLLQVFHD